MANMKFSQVFMIITGLVSIAGLVTANQVLPSTYALNAGTTSTSKVSSAMGTKAVTLAEEEAEDGVYHEATCSDRLNCCILDFTHVPCAEHKQPVCDDKGCSPVPPTIGFSHASVGPVLFSDPTSAVGCVNVLDKHGNNTIYYQFFIARCTENIHSVELYSKPYCESSRWNQNNTAGCHYNNDGIGSFRILGTTHDKREYLGGALLNGSDAFSTSAYPSQGNKASVTPADDCFDKKTGTYILGCKVERSNVAADALVKRTANEGENGLHHCPLMTGEYKNCSLLSVATATYIHGDKSQRCWLPESITDATPVTLEVVCPKVMDRSVDSSEFVIGRCPMPENLPKNCTLIPGPANLTHGLVSDIPKQFNRTWLCATWTLPGRPEFWWLGCPWMMDNCTVVNGTDRTRIGEPLSFNPETGTSNGIAARHEDSNGLPSLTVLRELSLLISTATLSARSQWPKNCKDLGWCINISFGENMCDKLEVEPLIGIPTLNVSEEGNYQCRNIAYDLNIQQFQVTYMESQAEYHNPNYGELTLFNAPDCSGDKRTVTGLPLCTTMPKGWDRILSYRVWLEGACGDSIGPHPGINGGKRGIDNIPIPRAQVQSRSTVTTKVTAPAASVGVTAAVTF